MNQNRERSMVEHQEAQKPRECRFRNVDPKHRLHVWAARTIGQRVNFDVGMSRIGDDEIAQTFGRCACPWTIINVRVEFGDGGVGDFD